MTVYKVVRIQPGFNRYLSCSLPEISPYCCTYGIGQTTMAHEDTEGVYVFKKKENALNFIMLCAYFRYMTLLKCKSIGRVTKAKYILHVTSVCFANKISVKNKIITNKRTHEIQPFAQALHTNMPIGSFACKGVYVESVEEK
jgi:hypothetical protein